MKNILYLLVIFTFISCKTREVIVEVPKIKTEIEYKDRLIHDSIYSRDSIFIYTKNDTVYNNVYKTLYKYKTIKDTINICKTDTISIPQKVEIIKEVNKLNIVQKILMYIGIVSLILLILTIYTKIKKC